jgi:alpha-ketoglutarate-dependent taurine dioxygenase
MPGKPGHDREPPLPDAAAGFGGKSGKIIIYGGSTPMEIVPLGPGFAAELRGVTLADVAADDAAYNAVRAAFEEHSVLVFRGQEVTDEGQLAFSRRFGPAEVTKVGSLGTGTHFVILTTIGPDGKVVPADHRLPCATKPISSGIPTVRSRARRR